MVSWPPPRKNDRSTHEKVTVPLLCLRAVLCLSGPGQNQLVKPDRPARWTEDSDRRHAVEEALRHLRQRAPTPRSPTSETTGEHSIEKQDIRSVKLMEINTGSQHPHRRPVGAGVGAGIGAAVGKCSRYLFISVVRAWQPVGAAIGGIGGAVVGCSPAIPQHDLQRQPTLTSAA